MIVYFYSIFFNGIQTTRVVIKTKTRCKSRVLFGITTRVVKQKSFFVQSDREGCSRGAGYTCVNLLFKSIEVQMTDKFSAVESKFLIIAVVGK